MGFTKSLKMALMYNKYLYSALREPIPITEQVWPADTVPLVAAKIITYNHEPFIRECIEGILMQRTTFPVRVVVFEDCSTDNTANILKEYEEKYPDLFRVFYMPENTFGKPIRRILSQPFMEEQAKAKYIAFCEGDDYWTDPLKLQKQFDFLEENEEYSLCVGGFESFDLNANQRKTIIKRIKKNDENKNGFTFFLNDLKKGWITKYLTAMVRKNVLDSIDFSKYKHHRDIHLFYHLIKNQKGFYFTEVFGVYNIHEGGINSMKQGRINTEAEFNCYKELHEHNKDEFTRLQRLRSTLGLLNFNLYYPSLKNTTKENIKLYFEAIKLTKNMREALFLISVFFSRPFKEKLKLRLVETNKSRI